MVPDHSRPQTSAPPKKRLPLFVLLILLAIGLGGGIGYVAYKATTKTAPTKQASTVTKSATKKAATAEAAVTQGQVSDLQLDTKKNYGNKYANGLLPVGDKKYVTTAPKKGYVYTCHVNAGDRGGAGARGPWFSADNTTWDINKKAKISGSVTWQQSMTIQAANGKRVVVTNDLPNHITGIYPVQSTDAAYAYDRNPNKITAQSLTYSLSENPSLGSPQCMGGEAGIMLTGVALFNGFDAGYRDAGAWEVQDGCDGHPQKDGEYHYHTLSRCITDQSVSTIIGYALDGFPITGPRVNASNILTTDDLDECHGITSVITLSGKKVNTYHYVMTQDFPYSVSCFRSAPVQAPHAAGTQQQPL